MEQDTRNQGDTWSPYSDNDTIKVDTFSPSVRYLIQYRLVAFIVSLLVIAALSSQLGSLQQNNDFRIWFPENSKNLKELEEIEDAFTRANDIVIVFGQNETVQGDLFTPKLLSSLRVLTEQAWEIPYAVRVDSLSNFLYTSVSDDNLTVSEMVEDDFSYSVAAIANIKDFSASEPAIIGRLLANDNRVGALRISISLPDQGRAAAEIEAAVAARELVATFASNNPDLDIHLIGSVMRNHALAEVSDADAAALYPLLFALVLILSGVLFRSLSAVVIVVSVLLTTLAATFSVVAIAGWALNTVSMASPIIILTVAVASMVHFLNGYRNCYALYEDKLRAIHYTYQANINAVFVTILTTCVGFLGLNFSEAQPFKDLGNITAIGIAFTFVMCLTVMPFLLSKLPAIRSNPARVVLLHQLAQRFIEWIDRNSKLVISAVLLLALSAAFLLQRNELTDDAIEYFSHELPIRQAANYIDQNLTGIETIQLSVELKEGSSENGINTPSFLRKLDEFGDWARQKEFVTHVYSYTDVVKRINQQLNRDQVDYYRTPENAELAAQYKLLYDLSLPQGSDANDLVSFDSTKLRLLVTTRSLKSRRFIAFENEIYQWFASNAPQIKVVASGEGLVFSHIGQNNIHDMIQGSIVTLIFITLVMVLALKSIRYGVMSILPNLLPCLIMFGVWGLIVGQLNMAAAMIFSMTIGIVVDDTVHLLMKYLDSRRNQNATVKQSLIEMLVHVMPAIITTSLIITAGFLALVLSEFNANVIMGKMVAMVVLIALLIDLIFIPAVMMMFDRKRATE